MPPSAAGSTLCFVVPFWNEIEGVEECVRRIAEAARAMERAGTFREVRLVLVDDGSTDGTGAALARHAESEGIEVVRHPVNRGLGAALRSGLAAVDADWAFYTDADLPVRPEVAGDAFRHAQATGTDVVSCIRRNRKVEGWRRAAMTGAYTWCVRAVLGLRVRDVNAPAKLIASELLPAIAPESSGVFCDAEMLARAQRAGARIEQIEVDAFPRRFGRSSLANPRTVVTTLWDLARHGPGLRVGA